MREDPPIWPGVRLERTPSIVRVVGEECNVLFSRLDASTADAEVAAQAEFFRRNGHEVEWKLYGHDQPPDLPAILQRHGFVPDPPETLVALDLQEVADWGEPPKGLDIRRVLTPADLKTAIDVSERAFRPGPGWGGFDFAPMLADPSFAAFVAYVDGVPVASGRAHFPSGKQFASLWGGGTDPAYRGRGVYRALVAARAELARERGFRFLTVDALETSRPILERVGFRALTSTTGYILRP